MPFLPRFDLGREDHKGVVVTRKGELLEREGGIVKEGVVAGGRTAESEKRIATGRACHVKGRGRERVTSEWSQGRACRRCSGTAPQA